MTDELLKGIALMVLGSWVSLLTAVGILKGKVSRLESDIDNIGLILGTKKALGRVKQTNEKDDL